MSLRWGNPIMPLISCDSRPSLFPRQVACGRQPGSVFLVFEYCEHDIGGPQPDLFCCL